MTNFMIALDALWWPVIVPAIAIFIVACLVGGCSNLIVREN